MKIPVDVLLYLQSKLYSTPLSLPARNRYIVNEVQNYCENSQEHFTHVTLNLPPSDITEFRPSEEVILYLISKLPRKFFEFNRLLFGNSVYAPTDSRCCKGYRLDPRYSIITVYDTSRVFTGHVYHGVCKNCKKTFYPCYTIDGNLRTFKSRDDIFHFTSTTAFSLRLIQHFSLQLLIGMTSFERMACIYNEEITPEKSIQADIIEEMFFIFHVTQFNSEISWHMKPNSHVNVEKICEENYNLMASSIDEKWINHICSEVGCTNRVVVCDGNEKLYRYICSKEIETVSPCHGVTGKKTRCIRNPQRGNQNLKSKKLCEEHATCEEAGKSDYERIDLRPVTRSISSQLNTVVVSGEGCKEECNVSKYSERTAGMFYFFRPCGVRLGHYEMLTAESLSSLFSYLIDLFSQTPNDDQIKTIVYDRACDLHPYLDRLSREGNCVAGKYVHMNFIVDIFHAEKHSLPKCTISSPHCKYHPDLPQFSFLRTTNTEICEQSFHILNPCKHITRTMTYAKRLCLLKLIDNNYNLRLVRKL